MRYSAYGYEEGELVRSSEFNIPERLMLARLRRTCTDLGYRNKYKTELHSEPKRTAPMPTKDIDEVERLGDRIMVSIREGYHQHLLDLSHRQGVLGSHDDNPHYGM